MHLLANVDATNTGANVIAAIAGVFTALSLVITAIALLWKQVQLGRKVEQVHVIVNQQRTDGLNFQRALIRALTDAGIPVPIDQSLPNEGPNDGAHR